MPDQATRIENYKRACALFNVDRAGYADGCSRYDEVVAGRQPLGRYATISLTPDKDMTVTISCGNDDFAEESRWATRFMDSADFDVVPLLIADLDTGRIDEPQWWCVSWNKSPASLADAPAIDAAPDPTPSSESPAPDGDYDFSVYLGAQLADAVAAIWDPDVLPAPARSLISSDCPVPAEIAPEIEAFLAHVIADLLLWADACQLDATRCHNEGVRYFELDVPPTT